MPYCFVYSVYEGLSQNHPLFKKSAVFCQVMNTKKLSDYLAKTSELCKDLPRQKHTAIIVSDSKGNYLQKQAERADANSIEKKHCLVYKKG